MKYENTVGGRIKKLREEHGITQRELADEFSIGYSPVISMYESEKRMLPIDVLLLYSKRFNVTTDWILKGTNDIDNKDELAIIMERIRNTSLERTAIKVVKALSELL